MATLKHSKQRESIKEFLSTRTDHPTADMIYVSVRETYPNISLGTVYRNLALLSDLGEIQKITTGDGPDRFDGKTTPHNHFICRKCHCVIDLEMENIDHIMEIAGEKFTGSIDGYTAHFFGLCSDCTKKF